LRSTVKIGGKTISLGIEGRVSRPARIRRHVLIVETANLTGIESPDLLLDTCRVLLLPILVLHVAFIAETQFDLCGKYLPALLALAFHDNLAFLPTN